MGESTVSTSLTQFLDDTGAIINAAMGWLSDAFNVISGNPILMAIVFGLPLVGLGIGMLSRLLRV